MAPTNRGMAQLSALGGLASALAGVTCLAPLLLQASPDVPAWITLVVQAGSLGALVLFIWVIFTRFIPELVRAHQQTLGAVAEAHERALGQIAESNASGLEELGERMDSMAARVEQAIKEIR